VLILKKSLSFLKCLIIFVRNYLNMCRRLSLRKLCICLFLFIGCYPNIQAQEIYAISPNSRHFASASYKDAVNTPIMPDIEDVGKFKNRYFRHLINVYDTRSLCLVSSFYITFSQRGGIDTMFFSGDSRLMYLRKNDEIIVAKVREGAVIAYETSELSIKNKELNRRNPYFDPVVLAHKDNYFVKASTSTLTAISAYDGEPLHVYGKLPPRFYPSKLLVSPDDAYIAISGSDRIMVWKTGRERTIKRLTGSDFLFTNNCKYIIVSRKSNNVLYSYHYELPHFSRVKKITYNNLLREYAKTLMAAENTKSRSVIPFLVDTDKSSLSPNGKFMIIIAKRDESNYLIIYDAYTGEQKVTISSQNPQEAFYPYTVANDSLLFFESSGIKVMVNMQSGFRTAFEFQDDAQSGKLLGFIPGRKTPSFYFSPDYKYLLTEKSHFRSLNKYELRPLTSRQEPVFFYGTDFLGFSNDGLSLFAKTQKKEIGRISIRDAAFARVSQEVQLKLFSDEKCPDLPEPVSPESADPDGYAFNRIRNFKHISELSDTSSLVQPVLKTMEFSDTVVYVHLHLIDKHGNYYYGAAGDNWKHIWCNILLKNPEGRLSQIGNFVVEEFNEHDSIPHAVSLVLDHSGSMGESRARVLQSAAKSFVEKKSPKDAVSIVKYDHNVGVEARLHTNSERITSKLKMNGLNGYGGLTALLDGANAGLSTLSNARGFGRKSVLLFTDGMENASFLSKNEVIVRAIRENTPIFVLGFGSYISEDYLKSIAYHTSGGYYRIYRAENFSWVFEDIYAKMRNYYRIRIKTDTTGVHQAMIKLCINRNNKDSLLFSFDNTRISPELAEISETDMYKVPIFTSTDELLQERLGAIPDLRDFSSVSVSKGYYHTSNVDSIAPDLTEIEIEFEQIRFPDIKFVFDKAIIIPGTDQGIEEVASFLDKYPFIRIEISGHTDDIGEVNYNQRLSEERAMAVKEKIVSMGINPQQIETVGYGESMPVLENTSDANRSINRRVEFRIL